MSGDGAALPFVVVATGFLALTLLGWRASTLVAGARKRLSRQG
ncbi:DUF3054 family protein [Actinomadura sp. GC306]|nr:DUF3054 family protein [Actinomadura sp. GC306]